ncbi:MAG TPA: hypothetical protein VF065_14925, partial [Ilumatobacter sp.]
APTVTDPPPADPEPTPTPSPAPAPTPAPPPTTDPALTPVPTLASVGRFTDRAGDLATGADLRGLLVRNEGVITIQSTHRNLTRRLGAVVTMYIDTRTSKNGPEYFVSAGVGPSTGWVVRKVRDWKAVGDPVKCTSTMRASYATERVTFTVGRACVGRPGPIRIAALVTDGRLKDWGPSKRAFNTWVARV